MSNLYWKKGLLLLLLIGFVVLSASKIPPTTRAQSESLSVRKVRVLESDQTKVQNPVGIAFSFQGNVFHIMESQGNGLSSAAETEIVELTAYGDYISSVKLDVAKIDPLNMAFDDRFKRLLIFESANSQLIDIRVNAAGNLDPQTMSQHAIAHIGLQNPQGTAVDPATGHVYFLDANGPRLVRVEPQADGSFANAVVSANVLLSSGLTEVRGLAFDPRTNHLHILSTTEQKLYEITQSGEVIAMRDLSTIGLKDPQAILFAPSGDMTDDTAELSLYISDSAIHGTHKTESNGAIVEVSFSTPAQPAKNDLMSTFQAILVQSINAWQWSPPSPDTAGITYLSDENRLLVSDSEVNEMPIYQGSNLFKTTFTGGVVGTDNTLTFSKEPTGTAYKADADPDKERLFISDDSKREIFVLNSGSDGLFATADDVLVSQFDTMVFNSADPEGVTYDSWQDLLYIVDGVNNEVYQIDPGPNNIFDGVDDLVTSFDTLSLGLEDPEGIAFNTQNGNLYAVGKPDDTLFELTTGGSLVQTIDISAADAKVPAGLAFAPSSQDPLVNHIYITARGVDNNSDPNENDGKIYEMTLPVAPGGPVPPTANDDSASTAIDTPVLIDVTINDTDLNGNLNPSTANTTCVNGTTGCVDPINGSLINNGDGTFSYTPNSSFSGNDSFVYEICDTTLLCDTAVVTITVFGQQILYISNTSGGNVAGIAFKDEDILTYDLSSGIWSMYIDGSDVGLGTSGQEISAFHVKADGSVLLSLEDPDTIAGIGNVDDHDIIHFTPTATGVNSAGTYELYFDGEDVGLENVREDIDAIGFAPDGRIVISTRGSFSVPGVSGKDEDMLIFTSTSLGANTSGTWAMYFDGSDVALDNASSEDVSGTWIDDSGNIYLSTKGNFSVPAVDGDGDDIFICVPNSTGNNTSCTYSLFWDGWANGLNVTAVSDFTLVSTAAPIDPPVANDDTAWTNEDTWVLVDVAANDTDPGGNLDPASAHTTCITCTEPAHGNLVNNGNGTFTYTPDLNFNGTDWFIYKICNTSSACDTATTNITVNPVADPPVANDDSVSTGLNIAVTINVAANDGDADDDLVLASTNNSCGTCSSPTHGILNNNGDGSFDYIPDSGFSGSDNFVYEICDVLAACDTANVDITVDPSTPAIFEVRVSASSDDAEEDATGDVSLGSSDLELVFDDDNQTVGIRFNAVTVPPGATIVNATIQFQADEKDSVATALNIQGEAHDNAITFNSKDYNISNRTTTTTSIPWSPLAWTERGEAGPNQQTPSIAAVIQEIVGRPGWTSGNSLVIIISGSGKRVAESFNGESDGAPLLHVEYFE